MRVALLWLAANSTNTSVFESKSKADEFATLLHGDHDGIMTCIDLYSHQLDKDGDKWRILKTITSTPKPLEGEPPDSLCPRCAKTVWSGRTEHDRTLDFKRNPYPLYCLTCGQRWKYSGGMLAYKGDIDMGKWLKRLVDETATQPELEAVA